MKHSLEFNKLRLLCKRMIEKEYPGYPFSLYGVIDFRTNDCYLSTETKTFRIEYNNWNKFKQIFDSKLLYHILDSVYTVKGSWLISTTMANYKTIRDSKWQTPTEDGTEPINNFYIDNRELTKLYFSVWSAIRKYKNTKHILYFMYNGEAEIIDVQVFESMSDINKYIKEYY